jgi:hypothetical protein
MVTLDNNDDDNDDAEDDDKDKIKSHDDATRINVKELSIKGGGASVDPALCSEMSLGERIKMGKSILTLENLFTKEEVDYCVRSCLQAATDMIILNSFRKNHRNIRIDTGVNSVTLDQGRPGRAYLRMSTIPAAERENNHTDALPEPTSLLLEQVLERALVFIDQQLCPSIKSTLFGEDIGSIAELFQNNQLEFSIREPAINIYTAPHGHFGMHKDNNDLTILVPLSDPHKEFTGGGTAFWSQSFPKEGLDDPSLVMTPEAGTAMLFGGRVSHKGMHIRSGNRVVFVASFSRPSSGKECERPESWRPYS